MITRYSRPEMSALWTPEARFEHWRLVELFALEARVELGLAPGEALADWSGRMAPVSVADLADIERHERRTGDELLAFLAFLEEKLGPASLHLHRGLASADVLATGLAMQLKSASDLLLERLSRAMAAVERRAFDHQRTPMLARDSSAPTTFGVELASWHDELARSRDRIVRARDRVAAGRLCGSGTFAHLPPQVEVHVCLRAGLKPAAASGPGMPRNRYAELLAAFALLGTSLERFVAELRQREQPGVREVEVPFGVEDFSAIAALLRGHAASACAHAGLGHEADGSLSAIERVALPEATAMLDFMLERFAHLVDALRIFPDRMQANLESAPAAFAGSVLEALANRGVDRRSAQALVGRRLGRLTEGPIGVDALRRDEELSRLLPRDELESCFDLSRHVAHVDEIFARVFGRSKPLQG